MQWFLKIDDRLHPDISYPASFMDVINSDKSVDVISNRERDNLTLDAAPVKDANGNSFATRLSNLFITGEGNKPWIFPPQGKSTCLTIAND
ncbi:hypothetical protein HPG69_018664 [Diceros bicornis minor]|uniref:Small ribosomal subunit protein eS4 C-terminal domain-containing protein n=1 Tax=Diceros bicornis minor TaxID=77932 RepID=A0A7J7F0F3_DICBM|nr:hypothetical protein HPG69_018664 [Diceros bicornis minor]